MGEEKFRELSLSAQTAYAELSEQTRTFELTNALAGLVGSFHKLARRGEHYWYFAYRDLNQKVRMVYVGPDHDRVRSLVDRFEQIRQSQPLAPQAQAALALGCTAIAPKHFRIIKRLSEYGFFRAGGILIGTHAFLTLGNLLGVKWREGSATLDVDFAHAGRNVSVALPTDLRVDTHRALESLEMGLLPMAQLGAQYRNPADPELRLDFVTTATRSRKPVHLQQLNVALQPLKFMEFLLEETAQGCVFAPRGACSVNLPTPERYAVHKLIISSERPVAERAKSKKDLLQAASIVSYLLSTGQEGGFNDTWRDAIKRGKGWRDRAQKGMEALLRIVPTLQIPSLWSS